MKFKAKEVLAQQLKVPHQETTTRAPIEEQLSEEELERLVQEEDITEGDIPRIQHDYQVYGEPYRFRIVSDEGNLFDIFPMPDGSIAIEPITLKVEYNPNKIKKYDSWAEVQMVLDQLVPGYSPYKAINAKLLRKVIAAATDDKVKNPYEMLAQYENEEDKAVDFSVEKITELGTRIGIDWEDATFTPEDLKKGFDIELEHGTKYPKTNITDDDPEMTAKIAWAHLNESPRYYDLLEEMEKEF
jgi:hypothetical protein